MKHYYESIAGVGNVALSRHAQDEARRDGITDAQVLDVLTNGTTTPDARAEWREKDGVRLVLITPTPFRGAKLCTTMYRVQPQAEAKRR